MQARDVLEQFKKGEITIDQAESYFRKAPFEQLGDYAKLDTHREIRSGFPEVVLCSGKADTYLVQIYRKLYEIYGEVFGTRASEHQFELVRREIPDITYDPVSRILKYEKADRKKTGLVAVCSAGTADIPVAEEAAQTAEYFGSNVERIYDAGVSGIHRLLANAARIREANCVIAVAGM